MEIRGGERGYNHEGGQRRSKRQNRISLEGGASSKGIQGVGSSHNHKKRGNMRRRKVQFPGKTCLKWDLVSKWPNRQEYIIRGPTGKKA